MLVAICFIKIYLCSHYVNGTELSEISSIKDTNRVFIYGLVYDIQSKDPISGARCILKGIDTVVANEKGQYKIDITRFCDSTKVYVLYCDYITFQRMETIIKGKIKAPTKIDIELTYSDGNASTISKEVHVTRCRSKVKQVNSRKSKK